jgi:hypothetical protein
VARRLVPVRITVECGGFTRAADACLTANHSSAVLTESLAARLVGSAGMAGDDATSSGFARTYDRAAAQALAALADLTHGFTGAGRLLAATGDNHARAESAAAGRPRTLGYAGGSLDDGAFVRVRPASPPSSLGAQEPSLGAVDRWILDQVEGFVWPSADVGLLRATASAWRRAAASTAALADHVDAAVSLVEQQRSPEVPLAVDALAELTTVIGDTAWQLSELATACEEYADAVDAARDRTRALLTEIGQMVVEGAAISVVVAGLSGGFGGGAAMAAAAARVRAQAPRFFALLTALRAGVASAAARMERVVDELATVRTRLEKFVRVPARHEVGSIKHPLGWFSRGERGWLRSHEVPPGHTIERHVGRSEQQLMDRLRDHPNLHRSSAFDDEASAERLIARVLEQRSADINAWMTNPSNRLVLNEDLGMRTGVTVSRDGSATTPTAVRVVLIADARTTSGWRILTAFPD